MTTKQQKDKLEAIRIIALAMEAIKPPDGMMNKRMLEIQEEMAEILLSIMKLKE